MSLVETFRTVRARSSTVLLFAFAGTLFTSALLLFSVEPMFAKMVLPRLGGSASVWSVALVFFQAMLLAGYAFAHLLSTRLSIAKAVGIHLVVCLLAAATLPIALPTSWTNPPERFTELWVFALFTVSVGLPFFAVSVNGPLLQAWFARTGHPHAHDPYFLYGASNLGSFAALLAYPALIEPTFGVTAQSRSWSWGFIALALCVAGLGIMTARIMPNEVVAPVAARGPIAARRKARWTFLAFVPSALLVALTQHVSTDIAAAPFLWVLPLSLFLLTFVLVFRRTPVIPHRLVVAAQPVLLIAVALSTLFPVLPLPARIGLELVAFFVATLVAHGELAADRPAAADLTVFYLWMSFGGVLGGAFAGLVAPQIFDTVAEYPLLLVASVACRPGAISARSPKEWLRAALPALFVLALVVAGRAISDEPVMLYAPLCIGIVVLAATTFDRSLRDDLAFAGLLAAVLFSLRAITPGLGAVTDVRSFYGVNRVADLADGSFRLLFSGGTIHGAERLLAVGGGAETGRPRPATYYWPGSPMADAIEAVRDRRGGHIDRLLTIGLGTGSLACHSKAGENWTFFEIDPEVVRLARDPARFRFLSDCAPDMPIVVGDGRVKLGALGPAAADLLVVDAFSSDSIPVHLLTREAFRLYASKLATDGLVVFHLQNKHMELTRVAAAIAAAEGWTTWVRVGRPNAATKDAFDFETTVVAIARDPAHLGRLAADPRWHLLPTRQRDLAWSDDHADVLDAILRKYGGDDPRPTN